MRGLWPESKLNCTPEDSMLLNVQNDSIAPLLTKQGHLLPSSVPVLAGWRPWPAVYGTLHHPPEMPPNPGTGNGQSPFYRLETRCTMIQGCSGSLNRIAILACQKRWARELSVAVKDSLEVLYEVGLRTTTSKGAESTTQFQPGTQGALPGAHLSDGA